MKQLPTEHPPFRYSQLPVASRPLVLVEISPGLFQVRRQRHEHEHQGIELQEGMNLVVYGHRIFDR